VFHRLHVRIALHQGLARNNVVHPDGDNGGFQSSRASPSQQIPFEKCRADTAAASLTWAVPLCFPDL